MKIHAPTKQILSTDKQAYKLYRELSGGKAEPIGSIDWISHILPNSEPLGIYDYVAPTIGVNQKQTDVVVDFDANTKTFRVDDMLPAEIAAALVVLKNVTIGGNRVNCTNLIYATYPELYQKNVGLGIYIDTSMVAEIKLMIKEENRVADLVDAAVDTAGVATAQSTIAWPTIGGA